MPLPFDFEFTGGVATNKFLTVAQTNESLGFTDVGVNFTWSVSKTTTGTANLGHLLSGGGFLNGTVNGVSATFTLDVTGVGQTSFSGLVEFSIWTFPQPVQIRFVGKTPGDNFTTTVQGEPATGSDLLIARTGNFEKILFKVSGVGTFNIVGLNATINCFTSGTRIATPTGDVAVENLRPNDVITRADGGTTTVKWLGRQDVDVRLVHPAKVNPICISAGALAHGVPARDLYVSQDHAIAIDGMLFTAGSLVNGWNIYQVARMPLDGFSYYHVETDAHELILAENTPAESFIDYAGRDSFLNGEESTGTIPEMPLPRISAARLVPQAIRARLAQRAGVQRAA